MYHPDNTISDIEEQIRVKKTSVGYAVKEWLLNVNNDQFFELKSHDIQSLELLEVFLSSKPSIY